MAREKDLLGAQHAWFSSEVIRESLKTNVAFVLENPRTSRLWVFEPIMEILSDSHVSVVEFHACGFEGTFKKPTRLFGTLQGLEKLSKKCPGNHIHTVVTGKLRVWDDDKKAFRWKQASRVARVYGSKFCFQVARLVLAHARRHHIIPVPQNAAA